MKTTLTALATVLLASLVTSLVLSGCSSGLTLPGVSVKTKLFDTVCDDYGCTTTVPAKQVYTPFKTYQPEK